MWFVGGGRPYWSHIPILPRDGASLIRKVIRCNWSGEVHGSEYLEIGWIHQCIFNEFSLSLNLIVDCSRLVTSTLRLCLFDHSKHDGAIALSQHLSEWSSRYTQAIAQLALRVIPGLTNDLILSFMWLKFWRSYERSVGPNVRDNCEHRYVKNLENVL